MNLMASLGLGEVEDDPNHIPDGKYAGTISRSFVSLVKNKNTLNHVIEFKVADGDYAGRVKAEFWPLGKDPVQDADGNWISLGDTSVMSDQRKSFYKSRLKSLGIPQSRIDTGDYDVTDLEGLDVIFGVKKNGDFINVNFVELRGGVTATDLGSGNPFAGTTPAPGTIDEGGIANLI